MVKLQEIFDTACAALIKQGRLSVSETGVCQYRGLDGAKCAVGHLIPDEEYNSMMDAPGGNCWTRRQVALKLDVHDDFLFDLQRCHDQARDPDNFVGHFKSNARRLAKNYNLNPEILNG